MEPCNQNVRYMLTTLPSSLNPSLPPYEVMGGIIGGGHGRWSDEVLVRGCVGSCEEVILGHGRQSSEVMGGGCGA